MQHTAFTKDDAARLGADTWNLLEQLSTLSETSDPDREGVTRRVFTAEHRLALNVMAQKMMDSGMKVRVDGAGNLVGRYEAATPDAPVMITGSHQDTVPHGGKYDGAMGVVLPLIMVNELHRRDIRLPYHIDVVAFSDEEGVRFSATLIGSSAMAGTFDPALLDKLDKDGVTMRAALEAFGCDPASIPQAAYRKEDVMGFFEVHIEQGPQLEAANLPIGVVSAIGGNERHTITVEGKAGHAGTVPMDMRQDALVAAAQLIAGADTLFKSQDDLVGVVGKIENYPNGINVIPQKTTFSLEIRSPDDAIRLAAREKFEQMCQHVCENYNVSISDDLFYEQQAVNCSSANTDKLKQAIGDAGFPLRVLFSGAGHDGLAMGHLTDVTMLFMRCDKGISHHPAEAIMESDLADTLEVMWRYFMTLK